MKPPAASSEHVRRRFQQQRTRDTRPEVELRRALHKLGLRYRLDRRLIPGSTRRADIVFPRQKLVVFVHGCFWHSCPTHATAPTANAEWWQVKLATNKARDEDTTAKLVELGWRVEVVWEHEPPSDAARRIEDLLSR